MHFSNLKAEIGGNTYEIPFAIEFRGEGHGEWLSPAGVATFTWIDRGDSVTIDLVDVVADNKASAYKYYLSDTDLGADLVMGKLVLEFLDISLSTNEGAPILEWRPSVRFEPDTMEANYKALSNDTFTYIEPLVDAATTPSPAAFGAGTWYYNQSNTVKKLTVDANGSVTQQSLIPDAPMQYWASWTISTNKLVLTQVDNEAARNADIYVLEDLAVGYRWIRIDDNAGQKSLTTGLVIKEDESLVTTENDWIGVWSHDQDIVMFTSDHVRRYSIAGWKNDWHFDNARQTLVWSAYEQGKYGLNDSCNPLGSESCKIALKEELKLVTKSGNGSWILMVNNFGTTVYQEKIYEGLALETKFSSMAMFGDWIFSPVPTNFYEAISGGYRVWTFSNQKLLVSDMHRQWVSESEPGAISAEIIEGKIHLAENEVGEVIELVEQNEKGLLVCQYPKGSNCVVGTEFWLLNTSPAKMSVAVEGEGYVDYQMIYEHFGIPQRLTVVAKSGYVVDRVAGCNGALNDNTFITGPIRENCTVTATFRKLD